MANRNDFQLPAWIRGHSDGVEVSLGGSLGPGLTLKDLQKISTDPATTAANLRLDELSLHPGESDEHVRHTVAALYGDQSRVTVTADDVIMANATTGANTIAMQALIQRGDHVVSIYPTYEPLIEVPKALGAEVSYWSLDEKTWQGDLDTLKSLLRPETKMIILNNPVNPTGSVLSTSTQEAIVQIAKERNITIHCDEIFRPLFHTKEVPPSLVEHSSYDRVVVTGSLSKVWGLSGIRIGWVVTRNKELRKAITSTKTWLVFGVSVLDEVVATEVLSERCKDQIMANTLFIVQQNLTSLNKFLDAHKSTVSCVVPAGGSTAFMKFLNPRTGGPVDDVEFCNKLRRDTGLLLSPGSLCFGVAEEGDFRGYVRTHITAPCAKFEEGLEKLQLFLASKTYAELE